MWIVTGIVVGICLSLILLSWRNKDKDPVLPDGFELVRQDSTETHDTTCYGKDDLDPERIQPVKTEYIYVQLPPVVVEKIRHDTLYFPQHIASPREHYYLEKDNVRIWYSGVSPRIDSLANISSTKYVVRSYAASPTRHSVTAYGELGYLNGLSMQAGVKYLFHPNGWLGIGGQLERDFMLKETGVYAVTEITFEW